MSSIDPKRWSLIERLFQGAAEMEAPEAELFLRKECGENAALYDEIRALLAAHHREDGPVDDPAFGLALGLLAKSDSGKIDGARVGNFVLKEEIARGGQGTVYLAEGHGGEVTGNVAIKIINHGMDTEEVFRQFSREREILSGLDHPNICRLLDGGATGDGRPYLVMEHIVGEPIDQYCDRQGLGVDERLEMFKKVCTAVEYAHQHLVIHRDLKPGNILVTSEGVPKLLDFGTARMLDGSGTTSGATTTRHGMRWMTPRYASPELIRGDRISTSTDIYSLGALLYELLTGRPVHALPDPYGLADLSRICEEEPLPPSVAVAQACLAPGRRSRAERPRSVAALKGGPSVRRRRRLEGDLDRIVLMALRKEPGRRYRSVGALADDVGRHLEHLPVQARGNGPLYTLATLARRQKPAVALGALLLLLAVGSGFAVVRQARVAEHQRDVAKTERRKAEEVVSFLEEMMSSADPYRGRGGNIPAREILEAGERRIRRELNDEPEIRSALLHTIGSMYRRLGLYGEAGEILREAIRAREEASLDDGSGAQETRLELAILDVDESRLEEAERALQTIRESRTQAFGADDPRVGEVMDHQVQVSLSRGDTDLAASRLGELLEMRLRTLGREHPDVANSLHGLGIVHLYRGSYQEAVSVLEESLGIRRRTLPTDHPETATTLHDLGHARRLSGDKSSPAELFSEALRIYRAAYGDRHPYVATALKSLSDLKIDLGDYSAAEELQREVLRINLSVHSRGHPRVAVSLHDLGRAVLLQGRASEARPLFDEAVEIQEEVLGPENTRLATSLHYQAEIARIEGDLRRARSILERSLKIRRDKLLPTHWRIARSLVSLSRVLMESGRQDEVLPLVDEALEILRLPETAKVPGSSMDMAALEKILRSLGRDDDADGLEGVRIAAMGVKQGMK